MREIPYEYLPPTQSFLGEEVIPVPSKRLRGRLYENGRVLGKLLNKQGPLDKQQQREAGGSLCRSGSAIFLNET